jgi:aspartyl protease family protein
MPTTAPEWPHLAVYAVGGALLIMLLQRLPYVGRLVRFIFSAGLLAFLIFVLLQQAPYQPELSRFTSKLGLDDQKVAGKELLVRMSPDGHFWVAVSINGVGTRMLIDSGATVTAISQQTARAVGVDTPTGLTPVDLRTANGAATAQTG